MKLGVLFSGGKDSTLAAWFAKKSGYELSCFITIKSKNKDSYMFHTPSISRVEAQAEVCKIPLVSFDSSGEEEVEVNDLESSLIKAREEYGIEGVVTGAVASVYQATRIWKVCNKLGLECFNPLWQKGQIELLEELISEGFEVMIVGVAAYPLGENFLGRKIDSAFILEMKALWKGYKINPAGEGGEFESFVLDCPLFNKRLEVSSYEDVGEGNSWRREIKI